MDTNQEVAVYLAEATFMAGLAAMPMAFSNSTLPEAANDASSEAA